MPRVAPAIEHNPVMKATLDHFARSASTSQALALRSRIVLSAAAGQANKQIATALQVPEVTVGKWRRCFASQGLDGLQDAARSGRPPKYGQEILQKVQSRACQQPEHYSRWSVRTLATDLGLPPAPCIRCWWPRVCSPIGFAPLRSVPIPISRPNCWTSSAST